MIIREIWISSSTWLAEAASGLPSSDHWTAIGAIGAWVSGIGTLITAIIAVIIAKSQGASQKDMNYKSWFDNTFTLLLEQHNSELKIIKEHINSSAELKNLTRSINGTGDKIDARTACKALREDPIMSSYFRILYQMLKFINEKHKPFNDDKDSVLTQQKFYSSIVRSYIDKDIIGMIACNCLMVSKYILNNPQNREYNQYKKYRDLIVRFSFLEHSRIQSLSKRDAPRFMNYLSIYNTNKTSDFYKAMSIRDAILILYKVTAFGDNGTLKNYAKLNHRGQAKKGEGFYVNVTLDIDLGKMEEDLLKQGF